MRIERIGYKFVEYIPDQLNDGVIYISEPYNTAVHKCCCGCGEEVVTPLNPTDWTFKIIDGHVSLYPSIGNWSFTCKSHYWIKNGQVKWSYQMSDEEIQLGRNRDKRLKERYYNQINQEKEKATTSSRTRSQDGLGRINQAINKLKAWMGF
ncbi:MAG: DUF6527 family protein [Candidatus Thiodiazotropha lotti]